MSWAADTVTVWLVDQVVVVKVSEWSASLWVTSELPDLLIATATSADGWLVTLTF